LVEDAALTTVDDPGDVWPSVVSVTPRVLSMH
jgi:hypothetical protein